MHTLIKTIFAVFVALFSILSWAEAQPGTQASQKQLQVRVLLAAQNETVLASRIAGRIKKITVGDGDHFKRGQLLVVIDCSTHKAKIKKVEVELKEAQLKLSAQRKLELLKSNSTLDVDLAVIDVEKAEADLAIMQTTLAMCSLKAPYGGRVVERKAQVYQSVTPGQPLLEILDDSSLELRLIIPSRWINWLKIGSSFTIHLDETNKSYDAQITKIGSRIDPASQSLTLFGKIKGDHQELIAGMSGTASFSVLDK
ncbi:MAG: efflux RND transporter periplasmic adaptor subunit [Magnetococcales bacterium]|nr:efflux RND transporter periplasmic adaptor subunit [Magnetococcales bacterium]